MLMVRTATRLRNIPGFTVVEVIVVIIVIGILATIVIVGYGAWRTNMAESELKSDLNGVYAGMEDKRNWEDGYPVLSGGTVYDGSGTTSSIFIQSDGVILTYYDGDSDSFCIDAQSKARPSVLMYLDTSDGNKEPKKGTCAP